MMRHHGQVSQPDHRRRRAGRARRPPTGHARASMRIALQGAFDARRRAGLERPRPVRRAGRRRRRGPRSASRRSPAPTRRRPTRSTCWPRSPSRSWPRPCCSSSNVAGSSSRCRSSAYLPAFAPSRSCARTLPGAEVITTQHLLTHTSGMADFDLQLLRARATGPPSAARDRLHVPAAPRSRHASTSTTPWRSPSWLSSIHRPRRARLSRVPGRRDLRAAGHDLDGLLGRRRPARRARRLPGLPAGPPGHRRRLLRLHAGARRRPLGHGVRRRRASVARCCAAASSTVAGCSGGPSWS